MMFSLDQRFGSFLFLLHWCVPAAVVGFFSPVGVAGAVLFFRIAAWIGWSMILGVLWPLTVVDPWPWMPAHPPVLVVQVLSMISRQRPNGKDVLEVTKIGSIPSANVRMSCSFCYRLLCSFQCKVVNKPVADHAILVEDSCVDARNCT